MPMPEGYIDVAARLAEMREIHPELTLQQVKMEFLEVNGQSWVVYTAAAYRTPDDIRPGIGTAWEPIPGRTNFTRDSEVQNAETSAWGRALIAVGASTRQGIASAEEVRNRRAEQEDAQGSRPAAQTSRQNAARGPQNAPGADVERILAASTAEPGNEFLASLAKQWTEKGTLSPKQIASGLTAANRVLDMPHALTPVGDEWPPEDERFGA